MEMTVSLSDNFKVIGGRGAGWWGGKRKTDMLSRLQVLERLFDYKP